MFRCILPNIVGCECLQEAVRTVSEYVWDHNRDNETLVGRVIRHLEEQWMQFLERVRVDKQRVQRERRTDDEDNHAKWRNWHGCWWGEIRNRDVKVVFEE